MSVVCAVIWCRLFVQVYGAGWLCGYMVSVACAAIWFQLIVNL